MVSIGIELNEQEYKKTPLEVLFLHNTRTLKTNNSIFSTDYNFTKSLIDLKKIDEVKEYLESIGFSLIANFCITDVDGDYHFKRDK